MYTSACRTCLQEISRMCNIPDLAPSAHEIAGTDIIFSVSSCLLEIYQFITVLIAKGPKVPLCLLAVCPQVEMLIMLCSDGMMASFRGSFRLFL